MNNYKTVISKLKYLTKDVLEITFKIQSKDKISFIPGQFIVVKIDPENFIMRPYSVLNYDSENNEVTIAVKKVEGGKGTTIIFEKFMIGKEVEIMGAMGEKLIIDKNSDNLVLIATGIGITPILCILNNLINTGYKGNIEFLYGSRNMEELYYINEITELNQLNSNINLKIALSRESKDFAYNGYVTDLLKNMNLSNKDIYMCSSNVVASSVKELLKEKGFDLSRFFCESA